MSAAAPQQAARNEPPDLTKEFFFRVLEEVFICEVTLGDQNDLHIGFNGHYCIWTSGFDDAMVAWEAVINILSWLEISPAAFYTAALELVRRDVDARLTRAHSSGAAAEAGASRPTAP